MSNENAVRNLIRVDDKQNPTLFRALQLLIDDLYKINQEVFPLTPLADDSQDSPAGKILPAPQNFIGTAYPDNLRLDWDTLTGALRYQIRMGTDWDTAHYVITTASDVVNVDPIYLNLVYGTYNFILRAMNVESKLGDEAVTTLIVPQIGPPDLSAEAVVSTVLLRWTEPASDWRIDHYIVYKNNVEIGTIKGTFKLIQEQVGGTYSYSVRAVDIVGNLGTISAIKTIVLHDPSEFAFVDDINSQYNGIYDHTALATIDNIIGIIGPLYDENFTWTEHYEHYGFTSPQDQIDAGYPLYFQPTYIGDGTYEEVFDFGSIQKNIKIAVDYNKTQIFGTTNIYTEISLSDDGITYTTSVIADSILGDSFRYAKVKWVFSNVDDKSLAFISNLHVVLSVTLTLDSGAADVFASDIGGTLITYNKTFIGINSVTSTPAISLQPLYAVCNEVNKTNFKVLVFDSSGNRHDATVSWKARGVV